VGGVTIDLLLALPGYEEMIIERAIPRDFGGWTARVCSAEDLIIQKAVASRDKDWLDVQALLAERQDELDYAYIEYWLAEFAQALESAEILDKYRTLMKRS
jgi:hypothetical protein